MCLHLCIISSKGMSASVRLQNDATENCTSNTEHRGTLRCIHGDGYRLLCVPALFSVSAELSSCCTLDCETCLCWTERDGKSHAVQLEDHYSERFFSPLRPSRQREQLSGEVGRCGSGEEHLPLRLTLLSFCH